MDVGWVKDCLQQSKIKPTKIIINGKSCTLMGDNIKNFSPAYFFVIVIVVIIDVVVVADVVHVATVARMFADGIVIVIVDHAQLPHHVTADGGLQGPVVRVRAFAGPIQPFNVDDFRVETFQDDSDILDRQVLRLLH